MKTGEKGDKYRSSGERDTRSLPATPQRLQNPKWPPGAPKWPTGLGKVSTPRFLGVLSNSFYEKRMQRRKKKRKKRKKKKIRMKIVATTSLPAVDRRNADRWNAPRSCQKSHWGEWGFNKRSQRKTITRGGQRKNISHSEKK